MTQFSLGKGSIARIEETDLPVYRPADLFPAYEVAARHHYDAERDLIKLSVHGWLLWIDDKNMLIDCRCGNPKRRPTRPFWNMLDTPYFGAQSNAAFRRPCPAA